MRAWGSRLKDQWPLWVIGGAHADVFYAILPVCSEIVETEAILARIDLAFQLCSQHGPLCRIDQALKNRPLHSLPKILAESGHPARPAFAGFRFSMNVVCDKDQHGLFPKERRVRIHIPAQVAREEQGLHIREQPQCNAFVEEWMNDLFLLAGLPGD